MGIQGLIPFLKKSSRFANLKEFKGQCAVVDAYCWLHKGAFSCADKLVKGEPTDGYIIYVMKQVNVLLSNDIRPILVFDGCHLPSKAITEAKRRENRDKNQRKAKELLREGNLKEAREYFQRCVNITSEMAHRVIQACREKDIDIIVAPYEADAQLAYLNRCGIADFVITEDSDLVLFGCNRIMFKLDNNGGGMLIEKEKLYLSMGLARDKFFFEKFRNMCILSGCDYLPSLHGIGLAKAKRFITVCSNPDIFNSLKRLPSYLNMTNLEVSDEYRHGFMRAINTIEHQLIFDPLSHTLMPLNPYPTGKSHLDFPYCGQIIESEMALQLALGNVNVQTKEIIDNYNPLNKAKASNEKAQLKSISWNHKLNSSRAQQSIWSTNSSVFQKSNSSNGPNESPPDQKNNKAKSCIVALPFSIKKRKVASPERESGISNEDIEKLYAMPKRPKQELAEDCDDIQLTNQNSCLPEIKPETDKEVKDFEHTSEIQNGSGQKPRNPFAMKSPTINAEQTAKPNCFSALRNFSTPKERTIVRSRYFKNNNTPETPFARNLPTNYVSQPTPEERFSQISSQGGLPSQDPPNCCKSPTRRSSTSSDDSQSSFVSSNKSFQWKKMSQMFSYKSIESCGGSLTKSGSMISSSNATRSNFLPPSKLEEPLPEFTPCSTEIAEIDSVKDERSTPRNPFAVIKTDKENGLPSAKCVQDHTVKENLRIDDGLPNGTSSMPIPSSNLLQPTLKACRTIGLSKLSGKKQLNLKEMFAFKKPTSTSAL